MNGLGFRPVDFHVHLPVPWPSAPTGAPLSALARELNQSYARRRRADWRREWGFPEPEEGHLPAARQAERWAAEVGANGLECAVLVTGGGNDQLAEATAPHRPRLLGMAHHDLARPSAFPELRRAVDELGMIGYKLIAPLTDIAWDHPDLEPLWAWAEERSLPVLIHFGWLGTGGGVVHHPLISPLSIFPIAHRHPALPIVVAHFGCGYFGDLLQLCWSCPEVYIDTSGSNQWVRWLPYHLDLQGLFRKAYETIGPQRLVFGTDSSWFPRGFAARYLEDQVEACRQVGMGGADIELVFRGNALRLLGLEPSRNEAGRLPPT